MRTDDLRDSLSKHADRVEAIGIQDRLTGVDRRVAVTRRRRRASVAVTAAVGTVAAVVALAVAGQVAQGGVSPEPVVPTGGADDLVQAPVLSGHPLPQVMTVNEVGYEYFRSQESPAGRNLLRVAVAPSRQPQALAWTSPRGTAGQILVSVDGNLVNRSAAGALESGILLSSRRSHLVVVRATRPEPTTVLGLALYSWPRP